ncbi:hypothetical protein H5410_051519, partial [Solanum commersonii]
PELGALIAWKWNCGEWQHRKHRIPAQSPCYTSLGLEPSSHTCEVNLPLALNTPPIKLAGYMSGVIISWCGYGLRPSCLIRRGCMVILSRPGG